MHLTPLNILIPISEILSLIQAHIAALSYTSSERLARVEEKTNEEIEKLHALNAKVAPVCH
jgi:hypothetical protein